MKSIMPYYRNTLDKLFDILLTRAEKHLFLQHIRRMAKSAKMNIKAAKHKPAANAAFCSLIASIKLFLLATTPTTIPTIKIPYIVKS
jgi:hypothetical protein